MCVRCAQAQQRAAELAASEAAESPDERKARLARSVMESDLENAKALLGDLALAGGIPKAAGAIETMNPKSRGEFDDFIKVLMKKISTFEKLPQYTYFVESLLRDLVVPLNVEDTRRVSSSLNAMINEKQKAAKGPAKGGKKAAPKTVLKSGPSVDRDLTNYDDVAYDDDDGSFM
eukprot:jgi/Hompol1/1504/HPOL_003818-RA